MNEAIRILRDAPLQSRNTFGVAATAPMLVEVADATALPVLLADREFTRNLSLVLGSGSNLLFAGNPEGAVLALTGRRIAHLDGHDDRAIVRADAGVE